MSNGSFRVSSGIFPREYLRKGVKPKSSDFVHPTKIYFLLYVKLGFYTFLNMNSGV